MSEKAIALRSMVFQLPAGWELCVETSCPRCHYSWREYRRDYEPSDEVLVRIARHVNEHLETCHP